MQSPKRWNDLCSFIRQTNQYHSNSSLCPNQSILKEISPENPLEGLRLKLKLQYFGHLMWRIDSFKKTLMLGKIEGRRQREWQDEMVGWHHQLNGHEFELALVVGDGQGNLACCSPWGRKESDRTEWLNWTETYIHSFLDYFPLKVIRVLVRIP